MDIKEPAGKLFLRRISVSRSKIGLDRTKSYRIAYEKELNPSQLAAATFREGPLLVIAGAGSGKTRTLTYRVARLVEDGVTPSSILLLTFTRKAAKQMLDRAAMLLDRRCASVSGGTFHSFANKILRKYAAVIGFKPDFTILDRGDAETLVGMIRKEFSAQYKDIGLPKRNTLVNIISRAVNKAIPIEDVIDHEYVHLAPAQGAIIEMNVEYNKRKRQQNFMDYDDLLVYLCQLLADHADIRRRLGFTYEYIMVDEYQDTNPIQAEIVSYLASQHNNVMVVGDDSQSIYSFRGADFQNIIRFPEQFTNTTIIKLEENYRSTQPILNLTNSIIERARDKYSKRLFSQLASDSPPTLVHAGDENAQSRFVTETIRTLTQEKIAIEEIAVLIRAGFHSFDLEIELGREKIPFVKVGGFRFVEAAHIKDLIAHLKVIINLRDRLSWYRILMLLDHIGPRTASKIYEAVVTLGKGYKGLGNIPLSGKIAKGVQALSHLYSQMDPDRMSVAGMGEMVLSYYSNHLKNRYDDHPKRLRDLEHLIQIMERYEHLADFLTDMALEPPTTIANGSLASDSFADQKLTISTIHSAKGLEWHTVFVLWALDGRFPSIYAFDSPDQMEEELRLMYVAATRAKRNLFLICPAQMYDRSSGNILSQPSRFIDSMPDEILRNIYYPQF
jgi:DNA helicase-2/ATP-dependent DNA helicase PcrA